MAGPFFALSHVSMGTGYDSEGNWKSPAGRIHTMSENTNLIERYYAARKGTFGFLERVELTQNLDPANWNGFQLTVILRSDTNSSASTLRLSFAGVQEFRIGELYGLLRYMLEIRCIEELQNEGRKFKITESEYDAFSFVCEAFTFITETGA